MRPWRLRLMWYEHTGCLLVEDGIECQRIDNYAAYGNRAEAKEAETKCKNGPEYHNRPVNENAAQKQYNADRSLPCDNPADAIKPDQRKDDLCYQRAIVHIGENSTTIGRYT